MCNMRQPTTAATGTTIAATGTINKHYALCLYSPICAEQFRGHYGGQPVLLLNRRCTGTNFRIWKNAKHTSAKKMENIAETLTFPRCRVPLTPQRDQSVLRVAHDLS